MKRFLRQAGLGALFHHLWRRPVGALRNLVAAGGPFESRRTEKGRTEMEAAAIELPVPKPPPLGSGPALELHLLTGSRFWYQTAFCLWTLARHSGRPLAPVVYDDGSLAAPFRASLARLFPAARFVGQDEARARLEAALPLAKFPVLRERWENYPNIRKLTDPHLGSRGWKLVVDSDLLFFRRPDLLVTWLDQPAEPLHAVDCQSAYGCPLTLMNELAGRPVSELVNVGLIGLNSAEIDWERIEFWCHQLTTRTLTSYFLEQALVALLLAGRRCVVAPAADYVTLPVAPEARECRAVMHHYVANSKRWYFQRNWRRVLNDARSGTPAS